MNLFDIFVEQNNLIMIFYFYLFFILNVNLFYLFKVYKSLSISIKVYKRLSICDARKPGGPVDNLSTHGIPVDFE